MAHQANTDHDMLHCAMVAILAIRTERFERSWISLMPPTKFPLNSTYRSGADVL